ncbi:MAG: (2Fe-2S)-binding protein [Myxococcota bacterium]
MIACLCHGVSERDVQRCIDAGAKSVDAIGAACGAGTGCGCCQTALAQQLVNGKTRERFSRRPTLEAVAARP